MPEDNVTNAAQDAVLGSESSETSTSENSTEVHSENSSTTVEQQSDVTATTEEQESKEQSKDSVPEEYVTDNIEMPEGMELDSKLVEGFNPVAKEMKLSQGQYETLCKHYAKMESERNDQLIQFFTDRDAARLTEIKEDPEIGGEKFEQSSLLANRVLNRFDTDGKYTEYLKTANEANNPELIRLLVRVGRVMSEDTLGGGIAKESASPKQAHEMMGWKSLKDMGVD